MAAPLAFSPDSRPGYCFRSGFLLRCRGTNRAKDARFLSGLLAGGTDWVATGRLYPEFELAPLAGVEMRYQFAFCGNAIMLEVIAVAVWAGDVGGIDQRIARNSLMFSHQGVAVDLLECPVFVIAFLTLAVADFHRPQWLGGVGFPVTSTNRTIQTFTPY